MKNKDFKNYRIKREYIDREIRFYPTENISEYIKHDFENANLLGKMIIFCFALVVYACLTITLFSVKKMIYEEFKRLSIGDFRSYLLSSDKLVQSLKRQTAQNMNFDDSGFVYFNSYEYAKNFIVFYVEYQNQKKNDEKLRNLNIQVQKKMNGYYKIDK